MLIGSLAGASGAVALAQPSGGARVEIFALPEIMTELAFTRRIELDRLRMLGRSGTMYELDPCNAGFCATALPGKTGNLLPAGPRPSSRRASFNAGKAGTVSVWLTDPVQRLGLSGTDVTETATLVLEDGQRRNLRLDLPLEMAFVDLAPRLVDLDGDTAPEIVVVRSRIGVGSSLAVLRSATDGFHTVAESVPTGGVGSWLKLAGIADFTGAGGVELATIRDPGPTGVLELWRFVEGYLQPVDIQIPDVSNHAPAATATDMSVSGDFDGDGRTDLVVPSGDRKALRFLSLRPGRSGELARLPLPSAIVTDIVTIPIDGRPPILVAGLEDSTLAVIGRPAE